MSTRTSISIATLVDNAVKQRMDGFRRVPEEYTNSQYFLFCYRKQVLGHYYATALFQASKGFVTCEVGVSRTEEYPYYRYFDKPQIGINGFRARTLHLLNGLDATTTKSFTGPDTLTAALLELAAEAASASTRLLEKAVPQIAEEYALWQPLYAEWQEAERSASDSPDRRYRNLVGESVARKILHQILQSGRFDGFIGQQRKFRYREADFMNCHVFLLAKALAFVDPPEPSEVGRMELDPGQSPDKILFDPIAALTGRNEQDESVELSDQIIERVPQWAFLRSFAALEAFFENPVIDLAEVKTAVKPAQPIKPTPVPSQPAQSGGLSLDELYSDTPLIETGLASVELAPLEPLTPEPKAAPKRPDPFELMLPYVMGKEAAKTADPFELLGAQFGLG